MDFTTDHQQQYPRQPTTSFVFIKTHQAGMLMICGKVHCLLLMAKSISTLLMMAVMNTNLNN